jgi:hypothetical protein
MWAAGQATQGLGDQMTTLRQGEQRAGEFMTGSYETGLEQMDQGREEMLRQLQAAYPSAQQNLVQGRDTARDVYGQAYGGAENAIEAGRSSSVSALDRAREQALGYGQQGMDQTRGNYAEALQRMQAGYGAAEGTLGQAAAGWDPLVQKGMQGYDMYSNSLGLGGAAGNEAARGAFQAGPGYQWQVEQATDAAQRAGNRVGGLYGGNVIDATTRLGSNLANQEYGNWQKNLSGYQGAATQAVAGQTGARGALAGMQAQGGQAMAGLDTQEAAALNQILANQGNIEQTTGRSLSDVSGNAAKSVADLRAKYGDAVGTLEARTGSGLADLSLSQGTSQAKLAGDYASQIAGLAGQYGGNMAQLTAGTAASVASAQAAANNTIIGAGTQGMLAGQQAANNTWGAIMGGLGIGGNLLGAGLKSGSSDSLIGQLFK